MAKYHDRNNNIGSILLDSHRNNNKSSNGGRGHFKLWSTFFGAAFRRKLSDTMGCGVSRQQCEEEDEEEKHHHHHQEEEEISASPCSLKLSEILKYSSEEAAGIQQVEEEEEENDNGEEETAAGAAQRKLQVFEELQGVVKRLQQQQEEDGGERENEAATTAAALDVRRLAKDDSFARESLAMLGAIPPLVAMLHSSHHQDSQIAASLYALLNLSIGNDMNKAAIVKAGAVHKMLQLMDQIPTSPNSSSSSSVCDAIVANFLSLSALDSNKPIIASSGAIPLLLKTLQQQPFRSSSSSYQAKQDALKAIYNLSIFPSNISIILETDLLRFLLNTLGEEDDKVSEIILSILSNLVSGSPQGRKAMVNSSSPQALPILVDALNWTDSPSCQEKASYILMVVAHKGNYGDRQAMVEAGIVSSLLELTLIGSTLAQKRASRILHCLTLQLEDNNNKGKHLDNSDSTLLQAPPATLGLGGAVSAPICCSSSSSSSKPPPNPNEEDQDNHQQVQAHEEEEEEEEEDMTMSEERKAVKILVQQSLQNNMTRIVKRANLPREFVPSQHFKSLTMTSTSKSLPF